jgi:hypothetical protein
LNAVIILSGNNEAVSFTDEGSPDSRITGDKVCVNGQVDRSLPLDWYYKIIQFFPDVQDELKSREVAERFKNFPAATQSAIWAGMGRVKVHIVDPRSHRHRVNNILRKVWKNDQAPQLLAQQEKEGLPHAKYLSVRLKHMVADFILRDSTAVRVQFLGQVFRDPFGPIRLNESLPLFFGGSRRPSQPLISTEDFRKPKSLIRDVTSWAAKASAAFHAALDTATAPGDDAFAMTRYATGEVFRRKMAAQLLPVHAFDQGNQAQLDLLDEKRNAVFQELAEQDHVYGLMRRRPRIVPVESRESYYVQAADIAAGFASQIYAAHGLIGVLEEFEYVTYNGIRVSRSDAEEEMRRLEVID